ncbi:MAG: ribonuclease III [Phycisphaerales bacterium]|nr:ribonuclease III [Phycisphaerales bacterium]
MDEQTRELIETQIGHRFADPAILELALTHASVVESRLASNERLEFLGDSILGLIVCERIFARYPDLLEGEMTKIKSLAVSRQTCALIAQELGLANQLILGRGMQVNGDRPASLAAAALESVVAAVYLDAGYEKVKSFLLPFLDPLIDQAAMSGHQHNFKSVLQQHAQQNLGQTPMYRVLDEKGPDHAKCFKVCVELAGRRFAANWGQSKKKAEQMAALAALRELGVLQDSEDGVLKLGNGDSAGGVAAIDAEPAAHEA